MKKNDDNENYYLEKLNSFGSYFSKGVYFVKDLFDDKGIKIKKRETK